MAVSKLNTNNVWQLISTTTLSGTTTTVSSLTGYKTLMVAVSGATKSAAAYMAMRVNGDTAAGNYGSNGGFESFFYLGGTVSGSDSGGAIIYDANQEAPHELKITGFDGTASGFSMYTNTTAITSISITTHNGTPTFTAGTVRVYGIPA
jgi:hypothetical protein